MFSSILILEDSQYHGVTILSRIKTLNEIPKVPSFRRKSVWYVDLILGEAMGVGKNNSGAKEMLSKLRK